MNVYLHPLGKDFLSYIERVTNVAYCYDAHADTTVYVGYCWLHS